MMEMMLTLFIISTLLMITAHAIPEKHENSTDQEVKNIAFFFQVAQTNALNKKEAHLVEFDRVNHRITIKNGFGQALEVYSLNTCRILQGGLPGFLYKSNGDTNAFGTIRFDCMGEQVSFIFQIQKGRFRIER
ncbi:competence protein ComGD [Salinicoccus halodurans]|uniref:Competence protein ComGD n=2 Tax=Salinicoccus halodurans TaxID=407035 RepID=A0A0F7HKP6_9STAP|nr:hypothetical protein [Salinicoccus halodurans]AKG74016.1 hypothetical protein AAT16_07085 [Salinicoccus halodurans]SFK59235.1 competence protein ComGD [Salinicoccus halodurans]